MYAIVNINGRQYKAEKDKLLKVDKLPKEVGDTLEFDSVLLLSNEKTTVGSPYIKGASVSAELIEHRREKKIIVFKYRRRKDSMTKQGHRQHCSILRITDIASSVA